MNDGEAPCRGCLKSGSNETCVLSRPSRKAGVRNHRDPSTHNVTADRNETGADDSRLSRSVVEEELRPADQSNISDSNLRCTTNSPWNVQHQFENHPSTTWTRAIIVFRTRFPEYGYFHPDEVESPIDASRDHHRLRLMALLAVVARYCGGDNTDNMLDQHRLIVVELQRRITDPPSVTLIHAYHLMGLWEWGEGHTYSAWIYVGIAIRMLQSLLAAKGQTFVEPPTSYQSNTHEVTEVESRTYWACALLDKQVSNGRGRPALLSLRDPVPPFPTSDDEFVFGPMTVPALGAHNLTHYGDVDYALLHNLEMQKPVFIRTLALGMNIWSKIHRWVALGGRKQPGMVDHENSPWRPTSQWAIMREELRLWRDAHHSRHKYPETSIMAHAYLHQTASVVHLNLVYYLR